MNVSLHCFPFPSFCYLVKISLRYSTIPLHYQEALDLSCTHKRYFLLFSYSSCSPCALSYCIRFLMRLFLVIPITSPQKTFDISIVAVEKWVRAEVTFGNQNFISFLLSELNKYFSSGFLCRGSSCFCFQYKLEHELQLSLRNSIQLYILYVQAGYIAESGSSQLTCLESV